MTSKKGRHILCKTCRVKVGFTQAHSKLFRISNMCRVLHINRSGYYAWLKTPHSKGALDNMELLVQIKQFYVASGNIYGSPRIYRDCKVAGLACSENRVARLMHNANLHAVRGYEVFLVQPKERENAR